MDQNERLEEIHGFITQRAPAVNSFLITHRADGTPFLRQVSAFVEGWTVQTISNAAYLKVKHLRTNPNVTYLWVQQRPQFGARNVWLNGRAELVDDPGQVREFLERRAAATGAPAPVADFERVVIRVTPTFLRAEGFSGGPRSEVFRSFPT